MLRVFPYFFIALTLISTHVLANSKVIVIGDIQSTDAFLKQSIPELQESQLNIIVSSLASSSGTITINQESGSFQVTTLNHKINEYLKNKYPDKRFFLSSIQSPKKNYLVNNFNVHHIKCDNCEKLGEKNLEITISIDDSHVKVWVSGKLKTKVNALKLLKPSQAFQQLGKSTELVKTKYYTMTPELIITDTNKLKYYKTNKPLGKGHIVMTSDLSPLNLVRINEAVRVKYSKNGIIIESKGKALQNGKMGQQIRIKKEDTGKVLSGRITDFGTVRIDV